MGVLLASSQDLDPCKCELLLTSTAKYGSFGHRDCDGNSYGIKTESMMFTYPLHAGMSLWSTVALFLVPCTAKLVSPPLHVVFVGRGNFVVVNGPAFAFIVSIFTPKLINGVVHKAFVLLYGGTMWYLMISETDTPAGKFASAAWTAWSFGTKIVAV